MRGNVAYKIMEPKSWLNIFILAETGQLEHSNPTFGTVGRTKSNVTKVTLF